MEDKIFWYATEVNRLLQEQSLTLSTAESCTGGAIAAAITAISGSSIDYKGGVVAYSNEVKEAILGVPHAVLESVGAVSEETVKCMAHGVQQLLKTNYAVATSGITGPLGGTATKPVGTVWFAVCNERTTHTFLMQHSDFGRAENARMATEKALELLLALLKEEKSSR